MSEADRPTLGGDEASLELANIHNEELRGPVETTGDQAENPSNGTFHGNGLEQELPELIRETEGGRGLMSGMPSINLNELTLILRDPSMPSHTIMKEVADMIVMRSEESESDDGSVGSSVGLQGLMNCIFEVAYGQIISNNSDDEDENFVRIPKNLPCNVCSKVFDNNMKRSTHVLVAHQDPSVLNISSSANKEANKDRMHASHRRRSKPAPKSEAGAKCPQTSHALRADSKELLRRSPQTSHALWADSKEPPRRLRRKEGDGDGENLSSESRPQHKDRVDAVQSHKESTRTSETSPSRESSSSAPPEQAGTLDTSSPLDLSRSAPPEQRRKPEITPPLDLSRSAPSEQRRKPEMTPPLDLSRSAQPEQAARSDVSPPSVNKDADGAHKQIDAPFTEDPSPIKQDMPVSSCEHSAVSVSYKVSAKLRQHPPISAGDLTGNANQPVPTDQIQGAESQIKDVSSGQGDNPLMGGRTVPHDGEPSPQTAVCCQVLSSVTDNASLDSSNVTDNASLDSSKVTDNASLDSSKVTDNASLDSSNVTDNASIDTSSVTDNASIDSSSASVARKRGLVVDPVEGRNKRPSSTLSVSPCTEPMLSPKRARQTSTEAGSVCTKEEDL